VNKGYEKVSENIERDGIEKILRDFGGNVIENDCGK
jgi:hypothetical protein